MIAEVLMAARDSNDRVCPLRRGIRHRLAGAPAQQPARHQHLAHPRHVRALTIRARGVWGAVRNLRVNPDPPASLQERVVHMKSETASRGVATRIGITMGCLLI